MLLWSGLTQFMINNGYQYMIGCASIELNSPSDYAHAAAVYAQMQKKFMSPPQWRVTPKIALPLAHNDGALAASLPTLFTNPSEVSMPKGPSAGTGPR